MKVSELIVKLQRVLVVDGDLNVYNSEMEAPRLSSSHPLGNDEPEDANCGKMYVTIE